jgi:hypothetical protein
MQEYKQFYNAKMAEYKLYNQNTINTEPYEINQFDNIMKIKQHNIPSILREYLTTVSSCFYINANIIKIDINIFPNYNDIIKYKNEDNCCNKYNIRMPIFVFFNIIDKEEFYFDLLHYKVWSYHNKTLQCTGKYKI